MIVSDLPRFYDLCATHDHLNGKCFASIVTSVNLVQFVFSQGLDTFKIDHIIP